MEQNNCNICNELAGKPNSFSKEYYDELIKKGKNILIETESFVVIPSFGPIEKSHVMIVPKRHINNFGLLPSEVKSEADSIISFLNDFHLREYNIPLVFFESGAGTHTNHSGGCIVHAHIHCVVSSIDFESALFKEISFVEAKNNFPVDTKYGYVWFRNEEGTSFYCNRPFLPSQFLRYLYLNSKDISNKWNWRRDVNIKGIKEVVLHYSRLDM